MRPTRRFWSVAVLASSAAVLAILFDAPLLLGVPLGLTAWTLSHQLTFTSTLATLTDRNPVTQTLTRDRLLVDDTTLLTIAVDTTQDVAVLNARLTITPPPALTAEQPTTYDLTDSSESVSVPLRVGVAGTFTIPRAELECTSRGGLFQATLSLGNECSVTGEPRAPRELHIGSGGEQIAAAYGEHDAEQRGAGFEPGELREYQPGDPTSRIDWKATARLGDPYVREFTAETTRQTQVVVDARTQMRQGPPGESKLDYAREVAIWLTEYTASLDDPLGVTLVTDDHITTPAPPAAGTTHYERIRRRLHDLATDTTPTPDPHSQDGMPQAASKTDALRSSQDAQRIAADLRGDDAYAQTLAAYFEDRNAYVEQLTDQPLFESVTQLLGDQPGTSWLVIVTDDTHRDELLETARAAASQTTHVSLFLLPSVLFSDRGLADLEAAYDDYTDFEAFRQRIAAIPNATAFEAGPRDAVATLLDSPQSMEEHR